MLIKVSTEIASHGVCVCVFAQLCVSLSPGRDTCPLVLPDTSALTGKTRRGDLQRAAVTHLRVRNLVSACNKTPTTGSEKSSIF